MNNLRSNLNISGSEEYQPAQDGAIPQSWLKGTQDMAPPARSGWATSVLAPHSDGNAGGN